MNQKKTSKSKVNPKSENVGAQAKSGASNREKDPADWVTADEPMTGAQASYLKTLCEEGQEVFDGGLNKAQASMRIDELRRSTGKDLSA